MSLFDDIIKALPENTNLRVRIRALETEVDDLKSLVAKLKDDLHEKDVKIAALQKVVDQSAQSDLQPTEIEILKLMPICAHAQVFAIELQTDVTRIQYHLDRLCRLGYLQRISGDPFDDDRYEHKPKAREYLVTHNHV